MKIYLAGGMTVMLVEGRERERIESEIFYLEKIIQFLFYERAYLLRYFNHQTRT